MDALASWRDGPRRAGILDAVARMTTEGGPDWVPPAERIAVFDNDGTLCAEKPMPVQLGFILERMAAMADDDPGLRDRQPWKAAYERDHGWLGKVVTEHYAGDDTNVKVVLAGVLRSFAGMTVDEYAIAADAFMDGRHPVLGMPYRRCGYLPMVELLHHLEASGFTTFIASAGDRDFMRPVVDDMYGIPPERVIGTATGLGWREDDDGGTLAYLEQMEVFDDGPAKPVRIWSRTGRRPVMASGNSNGDLPMLAWTGGPARPALRLLVLHDDAEREFAYTAGAERALEAANQRGWTVVSVRDDWSTVFDA